MKTLTGVSNGAALRPLRRWRGVTLIELMIGLAIVAIITSVALPSYRDYITRSSRSAAQAELMDLAGLQERIFLNTNAYTAKLTEAYNGNTSGGLGVSSGKTRDSRYTLSLAVDGAAFTLTATPVAGSSQDGDGNLSLGSNGSRTWGSKTW